MLQLPSRNRRGKRRHIGHTVGALHLCHQVRGPKPLSNTRHCAVRRFHPKHGMSYRTKCQRPCGGQIQPPQFLHRCICTVQGERPSISLKGAALPLHSLGESSPR